MPDHLKRNYLTNFLIIIIIFSLDRISKFYVILKSEANLSYSLFTSKFLNINLIWNEGIAFGLLSFNENFSYNLITILIILIIIFLILIVIKQKDLKKYGYILISGGALGNLFDRVYYRAVPDFIDLHVNNFHWFVFNIADIFITIGVLYLICIEMLIKNKDD